MCDFKFQYDFYRIELTEKISRALRLLGDHECVDD